MATWDVYSGLTVSGETLTGWESMLISSGGLARATTISSGGYQYVDSGSVASKTRIASGGSQYIAGGVARGTTVSSGGRLEVGWWYDGAEVTGITQTAGGILTLSVSSGGTARITGKNVKGSFSVSNGVAKNILLYSGGSLYVASDGIASNTTVSSGGHLDVYGATATGITQAVGGAISVSLTTWDPGSLMGKNAKGNFSVSSGVARNMLLYDGGSMYVGYGTSAIKTTVSSGGILDVWGEATGITQAVGGAIRTDVSGRDSTTRLTGKNAKGNFSVSNGVAKNMLLYSGGSLTVSSGGVASKTVISRGGQLAVSSGGVATGVTQAVGGGIHVMLSGGDSTTRLAGKNAKGSFSVSKGVAKNMLLYSGGSMTVSSGGVASKTVISSGGQLAVASGGVATGITQAVGGGMSMQVIGGDSTTRITGKNAKGNFSYSKGIAKNFVLYSTPWNYSGIMGQHVSNGGIASATSIFSGGAQHISCGGKARGTTIFSGGSQLISSGGDASTTTLSSGGMQEVYRGGVANGTILSSGGTQWVGAYEYYGSSAVPSQKAVASKTTILKGGWQTVYSGGVARVTTISSGGWQNIYSGGTTNGVTVSSGGALDVGSSGTASAVILASGADIYLAGGRVKGTLNLANADMSVSGTGSTVGKLQSNAKTSVNYTVAYASPSINTMLAVGTKISQPKGKFSISVATAQDIGTYALSTNIVQAKNTGYTVSLHGSKLGTAKLNGTALTGNGVTYSLKSSGSNNKISLTVAMKAGCAVKGTSKSETLTGTTHSDIFYGGQGNDTLTGKNGRDVAVYDTTAWGKDVIAKTSGTMTLLFNGLTVNDIVQKSSDTSMVITKKADPKQSITVKGWSDSTHNIVFGNGMTAFNKYLKAAKPTTAQTTAARNEVWKKAGLAAA